jgi:SAM-dependent methyltransferase
MFNTGDLFDYFRCLDCGCLQIAAEPTDIAAHYPANYYAYSQTSPGRVAAAKARVKTVLALYGPPVLFSGRDWYENGALKSLRDAKVRAAMKVLDIGCGQGDLLSSLRDIGFRKVIGADPHVDSNIVHKNGTLVLKCDTTAIQDSFDVVMMHHSFEHVWDQVKMAQEIFRLLRPGGRCIVRIPTIDSQMWEEYGASWVQLDPPRHFYLHSRSSIAQLFKGAGLKVTSIIDDSTAFGLLGSEKVRLGRPLIEPETGASDFDEIFSRECRTTASRRARELNTLARGDSIAVHARRT